MPLITRVMFKLYLHVVNNCVLNVLSTETTVVKNACLYIHNTLKNLMKHYTDPTPASR